MLAAAEVATRHPFADGSRVLVLLLGAALLGTTLLVVLRYGRSYVRSTEAGHVWRGLLPLHVVTIGLSYLMLAGYAMLAVLERARGPLSWRAPFVAVALLVGVFALRTMLRHQRLVREALPGAVRPDERLDDLDGL